MIRPKFANNEIYHIYNRGVDKRNVFLEGRDYVRFIHDLFEFNDESAALRSVPQSSEVRLRKIDRKPRKLLVEILCFCLMPNHYHLLLRQHAENGITEFMRKIGTGYTNYFNTKHARVGALFQGKFKAVHVNNDKHFLYLPHYIHLNPLDLHQPEWRDQKLRSATKALAYLSSYRWSSYPDYIGKKNFPSVTQNRKLIFGSRTSEDYRRDIAEWLRDFDLESMKDVILE